MSNLEAIVNSTKAVIEERYKVDKSQLDPVIYAFKDDKIVGELPLDFANDFMKDLMANLARVWLQAKEADGFAFISEAWVASYSKDTDLNDIKVMPRDNPERKEVVMVQAQIPGRTITDTLELVRGDNDEIVELKPFSRTDTDKDGNQVGGRWDLFGNAEPAKETA